MRSAQRQGAAWWRKYREHLASPAWFATRAAVLKRAGGRCEGCGVAKAVEVHHLTYATYNRSGRELLFELVALCAACHEAVHG